MGYAFDAPRGHVDFRRCRYRRGALDYARVCRESSAIPPPSGTRHGMTSRAVPLLRGAMM